MAAQRRCFPGVEHLETRRMLDAITLTPQPPIAAQENKEPYSVFAVDLDEDGDLDVVIAAGGSAFSDLGKVAWYENLDGQGRFAPQRVLAHDTAAPRNAVAYDLDGDADLDIVYANQRHEIFWLENLGKARAFSPPKMVGSITGPPNPFWSAFSMDVADLDGDGDLDVVAPARAAGVIAWFENRDGRGNFSQPRVLDDQASEPNSVVAADIDGDSDLDVVANSFDEHLILWYENTDGRGTFSGRRIVGRFDYSLYVTAADFDADGDGDVLGISGAFGVQPVYFEHTDGHGTFEGRTIQGRLFPAPPAVGDLDGDGNLDIVSVFWIPNPDGTGPTGQEHRGTRNTDGTNSTRVADIDGDGDLDILSASYRDSKIAWFPNDGGGTFSNQWVISSDVLRPVVVEAADIDGDGDWDLVSGDRRTDKIAWYENTDGSGTFGPQRPISSNQLLFEDLEVADVDGDGDADIVAASATDDVLAWYENADGRGHFGGGRLIGSSPNILTKQDDQSIRVADVDTDGDMDIVWAVGYSRRIRWYRNLDGAGQFDDAIEITNTEEFVRKVDVADFNNDGLPDIVSTSLLGIKLFLNEDGTFTERRLAEDPRGSTALIATDLDGDSNPDILFSDASGNEQNRTPVKWIRNLGGADPQFSSPIALPNNAFASYRALAAVDLDNDGDLDVVAGDFRRDVIQPPQDLDGILFYHENLGGGNFGPQRFISAAIGFSQFLTAADVDGDGDMDLFSASYTSSRIDWFRNDLPPKVVGDSNGDETVTAEDIDRFYAAVGRASDDPKFDLTGDGVLDQKDLDQLVQQLLATSYGDANLDGRFDSGDLVQVFQQGEYEDRVRGNSSWASGDWNGDREFDTADLVFAFQHGGYSAQAEAKRESLARLLVPTTQQPSQPKGSIGPQHERRTSRQSAPDQHPVNPPRRFLPQGVWIRPDGVRRRSDRKSIGLLHAPLVTSASHEPAANLDPTPPLTRDLPHLVRPFG